MDMKRKTLCTVLAIALALSLVLPARSKNDASLTNTGDYALSAAVLCCSASADGKADDEYGYLDQSLSVDLTPGKIDVSKNYDLTGLDVVFLDSSVGSCPDAAGLVSAVESFVEGGGIAVLDNSLYNFFPNELTGAKSYSALASCPKDMKYPSAGGNYTELQGIISDFDSLYQQYTGYDRLSAMDYGVAMEPDTAKVLAQYDGGSSE